MDTIKFARLVNWLAKRGMSELATYELEELLGLVKPDPVEEPIGISAVNVDDLLKCMMEGRKIDAIRQYRSMTGSGLREAKDAIEKYLIVQSCS